MKFDVQDFEILKPLIEDSIKKTLTDLKNKEFEKKIHDITETSKLLGKSYNFVRGLMQKGLLGTTIDEKHVTGKAINEYLREN